MRQRTPLVAAALLVALGVAAFVFVRGSRDGDALPAAPRKPGVTATAEAAPAESPRAPIGTEPFREAAPPSGATPPATEASARAEVARRALDVIVEDALTAAPIEGATVTVLAERHADIGRRLPALPGSAPVTTDARGHARVSIPRDAGFLVALLAEVTGFTQARRSETGGQPVPPDASEVRVPMFRDGVLRWQVIDGEMPRPADGTAIKVGPELPRSANFELATTGAIVAGMLVVEGPGRRPQRGLAKTPEGHLAQLSMPKGRDEGDPISFRAPRTIEVRLRNRAGEPVEGWNVEARQPGNMDLGPAVRTNAEGVARFSGFYGGDADVFAGREEFPERASRIGRVDLEGGSRSFEFIVGDAHEAVVLVTLDGRPEIPKVYRVTLPGAQRGPITEDRQRGELRFELVDMRRSSRRITVRGAGFVPAATALEAEPGGSRLTARLDLQTGCSLTVTVIPPADGRCKTSLERWDEDAKEWQPPKSGNVGRLVPGRPSIQTHSNLPPGRYRARDEASNLASAPLDLSSEGGELTLDLSGVCVVGGRVIGADGADFQGCYVRCEGEGLERLRTSPPRGDPRFLCVEVQGDGRFEHRFMAGRRVRLTAVHPLFATAADGGSLKVVPPRQDVVLRLERTTECSFSVPPLQPSALESTLGLIRVLLFEGEPEGEPAYAFQVPVREGIARFGGYPAGTWTVWIDLPGHAPLVLRKQDLGRGLSNLGNLPFDTGTTLEVRLLVPPGLNAPRLLVGARSMEGPVHDRWKDSAGRSETALPGLGHGRYTVTFSEVPADGAGPVQRVVTCDGRSTVELEYDAR